MFTPKNTRRVFSLKISLIQKKMRKTKVDMEPVSVHARVKTVSATADLCVEIQDNQMTCVPPPGAKSDKGRICHFGIFGSNTVKTPNDHFLVKIM